MQNQASRSEVAATAAASTRGLWIMTSSSPDWKDKLGRVESAISDRDPSRAMQEWREAYGMALRSRDWAALADAGDAGARIEAIAGAAGRYRDEARQAYIEALYIARSEHSTEGMLRAAAGFVALGDLDAADVARRLAGHPALDRGR